MRALWALIWQAAAVGSFLCRRPFPLPGRVDSPRRSAAHSERALSRASLVKVLPTRRSSFGPYGRSDSWLIQAASDPLSASKLELDAPLRENSNLLRGSLDNGLQYLVLPVRGAAAEHASVQLEVLSGSASEAEQQQGMAHLLEHVVFMDNPVRSMLANRGARTNAFTDFHHTVFHSTCPEKELLPSVFDALTEVIGSPRITPSTLQREKAAVLSEMGMVNSVEHRLDRAVLTALHSENLLSSRFPIGQAGMIASWGVDDVREYHISHYRPDNAVLYVVGDVDAAEVSTMIRHKFGPLESRRKVSIKPIAALSQAKRINRHIPSLLHYWSNRTKSTLVAGLSSQELPSDEAETMRPAYVYQHPLLHQVSFHMLAKTPIVPIVSFGDLKQDVLKQIVLQAALVRLTILTREGALCSLVNVAHRDFPREGCAVCSLDIAMETANWRESVSRVVEEIGRIASEGISSMELRRSMKTIKDNVEFSCLTNAQSDQQDIMETLMHEESCGHTHLDPLDRKLAIEKILADITSDDIRNVAAEVFYHFTSDAISVSTAGNTTFRSTVIACAPTTDAAGLPFKITRSEVASVVKSAVLRTKDEYVHIADVPEYLVSALELDSAFNKLQPYWQNSFAVSESISFRRRLSNGIPVSFHQSRSEPRAVCISLFFPGGYSTEPAEYQGALDLGAKTLQEGGAFKNVSRESVELFCLDHTIMLEAVPRADGLLIDIKVGVDDQDQAAAHPIHNNTALSNLEAAMQVARILMTDFKWEISAFRRAKQLLVEQIKGADNSLELQCLKEVKKCVYYSNSSQRTPTIDDINRLNLQNIIDIMSAQMRPELMEVAIAGDASISRVRDLALKYFGTLEPKSFERGIADRKSNLSLIFMPPMDLNLTRHVFLPDTVARAAGYIAGPSPNMLGIFSDGRSLVDVLAEYRTAGGRRQKLNVTNAQARASMLLLQEVACQRLFSVVREERQLTYDAGFKFEGDTYRLNGGYFIVSVTSLPELQSAALEACKDSLRSLLGQGGISEGNVDAAKRSLYNRLARDSASTQYLVGQLLMADVSSNIDIEAVTVEDVSDLANILLAEESKVLVVKGTTVNCLPSTP